MKRVPAQFSPRGFTVAELLIVIVVIVVSGCFANWIDADVARQIFFIIGASVPVAVLQPNIKGKNALPLPGLFTLLLGGYLMMGEDKGIVMNLPYPHVAGVIMVGLSPFLSYFYLHRAAPQKVEAKYNIGLPITSNIMDNRLLEELVELNRKQHFWMRALGIVYIVLPILYGILTLLRGIH